MAKSSKDLVAFNWHAIGLKMSLNANLQYLLRRRPLGKQYRSLWQVLHLDLALIISLSILIILGFFILYSAGNQHKSIIISQAIHLSMAIIVMVILAQISPNQLLRWTPLFYLLSLFLLFIVLLSGHTAKGAERWLNVAGFRFQPSELAKIAVPMMLAWYYNYRVLPPTLKDLVVSVAIIFIPALLVAKQPDLGTGIIIILSGACILLFAGILWRIIIGLFVMILAMLPVLWHVMKPYQKQRVFTFLSPERDPLGSGYHIIQSKIAIGSGGLWGKGWLHGTQAHLHFLPEHTTDFIFSVSAEEFGLLGSVILIALYLLITGRGLYIASQATNNFTRLLAASISLMFFLAAFINMAMVSGILPVVGVPLPLVSYSGTSLMTLLAGFGILMSIHGHKRLYR
ncbi:MAG: rod shape-determining protein RodA [Pseudomonadota bacterium]